MSRKDGGLPCLQAQSRYNYTGGHEGKKIALHCKNQSTGKWSIQEIREIFVALLLVRSRKYFFNSCPFFFIKELVEHK